VVQKHQFCTALTSCWLGVNSGRRDRHSKALFESSEMSRMRPVRGHSRDACVARNRPPPSTWAIGQLPADLMIVVFLSTVDVRRAPKMTATSPPRCRRSRYRGSGAGLKPPLVLTVRGDLRGCMG
jgi:hypothetical protein